jgi:hypothetical protein
MLAADVLRQVRLWLLSRAIVVCSDGASNAFRVVCIADLVSDEEASSDV